MARAKPKKGSEVMSATSDDGSASGGNPGDGCSGIEATGSDVSAELTVRDLDVVRELMAALDNSGLDTLELSRGSTRVRLTKTPAGALIPASGPTTYLSPAGAPGAPAQGAPAPGAVPEPKEPEESHLIEVRSPMVGTFYRAPAPEAPPYVEVGANVTVGQTLCILEAMKLMNELEAEVNGVIREILVENAEPVEYDQLLFRIEPAGS